MHFMHEAHSDSTGLSRDVLEELVNIRSITASKSAFAAVRADGYVVTWGDYMEDSDMPQFECFSLD